jgi:hypothetical protein
LLAGLGHRLIEQGHSVYFTSCVLLVTMTQVSDASIRKASPLLSPEFTAFGVSRWTKREGRSVSSCGPSVYHLPRRSGRSPALPYPPSRRG